MDAEYGLSTCGQSWRDCQRADKRARLVLLLTIAGRPILAPRSMKGTEAAQCPSNQAAPCRSADFFSCASLPFNRSKPLCRGTSASACKDRSACLRRLPQRKRRFLRALDEGG